MSGSNLDVLDSVSIKSIGEFFNSSKTIQTKNIGSSEKKNINAVSLFSGCGGMDLGFF